MSADGLLGRPTAMEEVQNSFRGLDAFVYYFAWCPHQKDAVYPDKVEQWFRFIRVSSEYLLQMQRINLSMQRMDISKSAVRIKGYQPAT